MGSTQTSERLDRAVEYFIKLIGPALVLIVGLWLEVNTHILHPPPDPVTVASGGTLIALALGRGFDKIDKIRGRG